MPDNGSASTTPMPVVRVDIDHRGRVATHWVNRLGFVRLGKKQFYANAGELLSDLLDLGARESPTEGSLVVRVNRLACIIAAQPLLEAAIGFIDRYGEHGLVRVTGVPEEPLSDV